ncbi:NUDIX domain-containing protein [Halorussus gelatinilyticus]|uniref:NUDIX domain-containing protein n=1 Tax=Halorussus gelatinilyticus TaxID=2937524 RepID=A0A8U0II24_9EURY|nr:NUDIX domain-containing protein [Halorussus gelatinilyticus]UPW00737.1 NUDIX domain-containing protein [Halorussus gelatinilyticus]
MAGTDDAAETNDDAIRVTARGVVTREEDDGRRGDGDSDEELLVERERDPAGEAFYRPLGGGVEFGEHSRDALRREFREELGVELAAISSLGTYEDVFTVAGETQHEVWRLYEADIAASWPYEEDAFTATEPETGEEIACVWKSVGELEGDGETFYPAAALSDL